MGVKVRAGGARQATIAAEPMPSRPDMAFIVTDFVSRRKMQS